VAGAKLSITLPAKQAASIRKAVKSGAFKSDSEVIIDALRAWQEETEYLRQAWEEGLASGTAGEWNVDEFLKDARERKARRTSSKRSTKAR
jgi:antitoxin ParD1/3/4